jgi:serine protease AprX
MKPRCTLPASAPRASSRPFVLDLGGQRFDPLLDTRCKPKRRPRKQAAVKLIGDSMQFHGPVKPEWLTHLRAAGVVPAQYIHPYTYVVWSDATAQSARAASLHAEVRWTVEASPPSAACRLPAGQRHLDASLRRSMALVSRHA